MRSTCRADVSHRMRFMAPASYADAVAVRTVGALQQLHRRTFDGAVLTNTRQSPIFRRNIVRQSVQS
jgi:hypothetical protein